MVFDISPSKCRNNKEIHLDQVQTKKTLRIGWRQIEIAVEQDYFLKSCDDKYGSVSSFYHMKNDSVL